MTSINGYVIRPLPRDMRWFGLYDVRTGALVHVARTRAGESDAYRIA